MTTQQTAAICNRHIARLMTDLETLGCSVEVKNTVRTEMRWLRNDLTKDGPVERRQGNRPDFIIMDDPQPERGADYAEAMEFYKRKVCHLPDGQLSSKAEREGVSNSRKLDREFFKKFMPWIGKPSAKINPRLAESALDMCGER